MEEETHPQNDATKEATDEQHEFDYTSLTGSSYRNDFFANLESISLRYIVNSFKRYSEAALSAAVQWINVSSVCVYVRLCLFCITRLSMYKYLRVCVFLGFDLTGVERFRFVFTHPLTLASKCCSFRVRCKYYCRTHMYLYLMIIHRFAFLEMFPLDGR